MTVDCLLLNLTRFGDLIQSQSLIHELNDQGLRVGILCQENFVKTCELLDGVSFIKALPGARLLKDLDISWQEAFYDLRAFCDSVKKEADIRAVLNLTPTLPARLLAFLLAPSPDTVYGFSIDEQGFGENKGFWATFLLATTLARQNAVFNISDMFRKMGQVLTQKECTKKGNPACKRPQKEAIEQADALLASLNRSTQEKKIEGYIAIQLGASAKARQWPTEYFAKVCDRLWEKKGICPVLTGTESESTLAQKFIEASQCPYCMAVGKTSLTVLSALLCKVQLLLSNDTGTLHLASAVGTKSVSIFLATAQPWDTGPNLEGCICLEPDLACHPCEFNSACKYQNKCLTTLEPLPLADAIICLLENKQIDASTLPNVRIWQTTKDAEGLNDLVCISRHKKDDRTQWIRQQRNFWSQLLDDLQGIRREKTSVQEEPITISKTFAAQILQSLDQSLSLLHALIDQGYLLEKSPRAGTLFLRNCDRLQTILTTNTALVSIGNFWRELRGNLGQNIPKLLTSIAIFEKHLTALRDKIKLGTETA